MSAPLIAPVNLATAEARTVSTLNAVKARIGMIPNLYATLAQSAAALDATLAVNAAASKGSLSAAEREIIALATAQANACHYCLSAHTLMASHAGLSAEQVAQARAGNGKTPREAAIAALARGLVAHRGHVAEDDVGAARAAGLGDAELMEIVVGVAANTLTNYANNLARTSIDFPVVPMALAA